MGKRSTRVLFFIHKWTGLITGINLLILSVTGAWLVFDTEFERAFAVKTEVLTTVDMKGAAPIQSAVDFVCARHPDARPLVLFRQHNEEGITEIVLSAGPRYKLDLTSGEVSASVRSAANNFDAFMLTLHANLFLGFPGVMLVGCIGVFILVSLVSGLFIYGPFMKQALVDLVRWDRGARRWSSDLHKIVGCVSLAFNLVLTVSGIALAFGNYAIRIYWMFPIIAAMGQEAHAAAPVKPPTVDSIMRSGAPRPGLYCSSLSYPGGQQGPGHYLAFYRNRESVFSLVPAISFVPADGGPARVVQTPLWVTLTMITGPFHFGEFAGLGMKVVYCILGLSGGALGVTGGAISGLTWWKRWRTRRGVSAETWTGEGRSRVAGRKERPGLLSPNARMTAYAVLFTAGIAIAYVPGIPKIAACLLAALPLAAFVRALLRTP